MPCTLITFTPTSAPLRLTSTSPSVQFCIFFFFFKSRSPMCCPYIFGAVVFPLQCGNYQGSHPKRKLTPPLLAAINAPSSHCPPTQGALPVCLPHDQRHHVDTSERCAALNLEMEVRFWTHTRMIKEHKASTHKGGEVVIDGRLQAGEPGNVLVQENTSTVLVWLGDRTCPEERLKKVQEAGVW